MCDTQQNSNVVKICKNKECQHKFVFKSKKGVSMQGCTTKKCGKCGKHAKSNRSSVCIDPECDYSFPSGHKTKKKKPKKSKKVKAKTGHKRKNISPLKLLRAENFGMSIDLFGNNFETTIQNSNTLVGQNSSVNDRQPDFDLFNAPLNERQSSLELIGLPPLNERQSSLELIGLPPLNERQSSLELIGTPLNERQSSLELIGTPLNERQSSLELIGTPLNERQSSLELIGTPSTMGTTVFDELFETTPIPYNESHNWNGYMQDTIDDVVSSEDNEDWVQAIRNQI